MAIDAFLYFPRSNDILVQGETRDSEFKDKHAFELTGFSFGAETSLTVGSGTGGAGGGKTDFNPFNVNKMVDTGSCALFQTLCISDHLPEAILELRRAGASSSKSGATFMKFHFLQVVVKDISWTGDDENVSEEVNFEYGAMKIEYMLQGTDGKLKKAPKDGGEAKWSQVLNQNVYRI